MRRLTVTLALTAALAPVLLALPVAASAAPHVHPVTTTTREVPVLPGRPGSALLAEADPVAGASFAELGATWDAGTLAAGQQVEVRTHAGGRWSAWQALEVTDVAADPGSKDDRAAARRHVQQVTEPIWVGRSDTVQGRVRAVGPAATHASAPSHLSLVLIDPGTSAADANPTGQASAASTASASEAKPAILTRAQWGADESLRATNGVDCTRPSYSPTVKIGFVHHTDGSNGYASSDVPAILRGIYAYHVRTQGWCDIGYNFLIDRFGRTWEGRYGGMDKAVIGAHTGGFNENSFAASLIGTYSSLTPSSAMLTALERLYAWKLGLYHRNPLGTSTLISAGGPYTGYAQGTVVTFKTISGHRDADYTSCPGQAAYDQLGSIRNAVRADMGATLVEPASSTTTAPYGGSGPTVTAGVLEAQSWQLVLRRVCDASVLRTWSGSTATSLAVHVDLRDAAGRLLRPGAYLLELTSAAGSNRAVPFSAPLEVTTTLPAPAAQSGVAAAGAPAGYVSVAPVRVLDTRTGTGRGGAAQPLGPRGRLDLQVTGVGGVPSTGVAAVAVNVTGVCASAPTYLAVYPADSAQPGTSVIDLDRGSTRASLVLPRVGADGRISIANAAGYTDVLADVVGYYPTTPGASLYHPVGPRRLADTRTTGTRVRGGSSLTVPVAGLGEVPATATAVIVNVTAVRPTAPGFLTVSPDVVSTSRPSTSTLDYLAGEVVPNRAVTGLSAGALSVYSSADSDVLVDLVGWYGPAADGGQRYTALTPARLLDTRTGLGAPRAQAGSGSTTPLTVAGRAGVPAGAKAVVVSLLATGSTASGYVTAWGDGPRPDTSDLDLVTGSTVTNLAVVPLSTAGQIQLYNAAGRTDLVADVLGYYR